MKINYKVALELVACYQMRYNTQFEISPIYSLYPEEGEYGFTESWPFHNNGGVYLILDESKNVIYVGKADRFGRRLSDHFRVDPKGGCRIHAQGWKNEPRYVINIKVTEERLYENLSLEGYLINILDPDDNTIGRNMQQS